MRAQGTIEIPTAQAAGQVVCPYNGVGDVGARPSTDHSKQDPGGKHTRALLATRWHQVS